VAGLPVTDLEAEPESAAEPCPDADAKSRDEANAESESESESDPDRAAPAGATRWTTAAVALVVVIIALVVLGLLCLSRVQDDNAAASRDQQILQDARQMVVNLTTLKQATAQQDIARLLQGATGQFRQQFGDASGSFQTVLHQAQVDSTGQVKEAAIESSDDQKASVLVAASATVKNTEAPQGQSRVYRMRVSMEHSGDSWLVSNVEFVP
jgi:Mce-associated membrane protein